MGVKTMRDWLLLLLLRVLGAIMLVSDKSSRDAIVDGFFQGSPVRLVTCVRLGKRYKTRLSSTK